MTDESQIRVEVRIHRAPLRRRRRSRRSAGITSMPFVFKIDNVHLMVAGRAEPLHHVALTLDARRRNARRRSRTISASARSRRATAQFYLNGEPLYLRGALDQDYYPDTICTVPSVEFLEDQFRKAKELGLNCLRCHIKAADPRYYEVADRIGMLIWTELPNGGIVDGTLARSQGETAQGHRRPRRQPSVDHHLDDHQRELGRRPRPRRGPPRLAEADLRLAEGLRSDPPRRRQLAARAELPCRDPTSPTTISTPPFPTTAHAWDKFVDELSQRAHRGSIRPTATR